MTRTVLWVLRGIAVTAFIVFMAIVLLFIDPNVWQLDGPWGIMTTLVGFATQTRNVITLIAEFFSVIAAMIGAAIGIYFLPGSSFLILFQQFETTINAFFQALGFSYTGILPSELPVKALLITQNFLLSLYFLGFYLLLTVGLIAGILSFLRISGRLASICFISMMAIAILGAGGVILNIPGSIDGYFMVPWSKVLPEPSFFFVSIIFLVGMIGFIYLEASYQVVYFYSLLEPAAIREEQLRRQLHQIQTDAQSQVPTERRDIPVPTALQRMLGSDAFRLMRQVIERKLLRREWLVELKDTHEIRRLNTYTNRLFREDPEAERVLTARASVPSLKKMTILSIGSIAIRFLFIIIVAFFCLYPEIFLFLINAPLIIIESVEFMFLPEKTLFLLLPFSLLFPLIATIISYIRQRRTEATEQPRAEELL